MLCIVLSVCMCYFVFLCIVVPLPPGTYSLPDDDDDDDDNNNNNNNNNNIQRQSHTPYGLPTSVT